MAGSTACEICGRRSAEITCKKCGRHVCRECFDFERGVCLVCSETLCERCGRKHSVERCQICGRSICPDCLVRIDKARAVCIDCFNKLGMQGAVEVIRKRSNEEKKVLASRLSF